MKNISLFVLLNVLISIVACGQAEKPKESKTDNKFEIVKTEDEWKAQLSSIEYDVLRNEGTERAFSGKYVDWKLQGTFICNACKNPLFKSKTKFKSGTGWPSFYDYIKGSLTEQSDTKYGWNRLEVECGRCGSHLGHVFDDGPNPTGLRYCINSVSLDFIEE